MKTVKINFVGFWDNFNPEYNVIYKVLKKHYNVVVSDDAEYIICSPFGKPYEYCKYPQIRIMECGENYIPDMNLIDYAIQPYPISFLDRVAYYPGCFYHLNHCLELQHKNRDYSVDFISQKEYFANFIAGHESEYNIRGDFFKKLCEYKRVESVGSYLNNMPNGETVDWTNSSKTEFQRKCKFTLCFESTKHEGFITEKITDAFYSDTIPVYFGSSTVTEIFNPKAFVYCTGVDDFDRAIQQIIELDQDDEKYLEMLRQPIFNDPEFPSKTVQNMEEFVLNIFEQPVEKAYRRSRVYAPQKYNDYLKEALNSSICSKNNLLGKIKACVSRIMRNL